MPRWREPHTAVNPGGLPMERRRRESTQEALPGQYKCIALEKGRKSAADSGSVRSRKLEECGWRKSCSGGWLAFSCLGETFDCMFTMSGFQARAGFGNKYVTEVQ